MSEDMLTSKPKKPVGIKDVANLAGVSVSTVSNVLNGTKAVSEELRSRVMQAVEELHYEVNMVARGLKSGKTNNLAVIVSSLTSVFFPPLLQAIQSSANEHGYMVSVFATDGDFEKEKKFIHMLRMQWIDGILLSSCADISSPKRNAYIQELSSLQNNGRPIPVICLESELGSSLDAVVVDDVTGITDAVEHLYHLGRRNIAYISFPESYTMGKFRRKGYEQALRSLDLNLNKRLIAMGSSSPQSGYDAMKILLSSGEKIDAVIAGNDQMAIGAMRAVLDEGLRIPEDIALVGYDDNFPASLTQLSTIHVPREDMGRSAFELFLRRSNSPDASRILVRLNGTLVVRRSTVAGADSPWELSNW